MPRMEKSIHSPVPIAVAVLGGVNVPGDDLFNLQALVAALAVPLLQFHHQMRQFRRGLVRLHEEIVRAHGYGNANIEIIARGW